MTSLEEGTGGRLDQYRGRDNDSTTTPRRQRSKHTPSRCVLLVTPGSEVSRVLSPFLGVPSGLPTLSLDPTLGGSEGSLGPYH